MSEVSGIRLTHKGRAYVATRLYGPATFRQISDLLADHLAIDAELFWESDSHLVFAALADLVEEGKLTFDGWNYRCVI